VTGTEPELSLHAHRGHGTQDASQTLDTCSVCCVSPTPARAPAEGEDHTHLASVQQSGILHSNALVHGGAWKLGTEFEATCC
jgi:hypothetical protein